MFVRKKSVVPAVLEVWLAGLLFIIGFIIGVIAFFFAASVFVRSAFAAPFLVCDPYPTINSGSPVPTEFVVTISGIPAPITTPAVAVGENQVAMKLDLGPLNLTGVRTATAKAKNIWGESAASSPFTFTAAAPVTPTGFGLSAQ